MEIFIIVLLVIFLFYIKSAFNSRFDSLEDRFRELNKRLDNFKQEQKPEVRSDWESAERIIPKPLPVEKVPPIVSPTIKINPDEKSVPVVETIKPLATKLPENTENEKKVVFSMDSYEDKPTPKPETWNYVPEKSWWETFKEKNPDLEKFIGENIINKIGVLILVLGISYFVKYAIDKDWINEPARVGIGVLAGAIVMGFAHKLRKNFAAFSSVLVAGAIAIFYFTIAIAFHDYHLFGQTVAFVIMVVITAFSALISLSYNRLELAVLSLIGGFAVPFMVSTGEGNYIVLFTYIAILDVGILALAYHKKWSLINILSYVFTVLLFGGWLIKDIQSDLPHYQGALVFAFVFYLLFILINIINNLRTKGQFSATELSVLASNTFLFYAAGMVILENYHPEWKGLFTTLLGVMNFVYAWFLYKKFGLDKTAVYLLIGLTLTFITLAVPVQFEGNYITLFWAAEGVILMWLAQKSGFVGYRFVSVVVHILMVMSLIMDFLNIYNSNMILDIVANPAFMTGTFSFISLFAVVYLLKKENGVLEQFNIQFNPESYRKMLFVFALALAYTVGILEVNYQAHDLLANSYSAKAFPVVYHLLFTALLAHFNSKTDSGRKITSILGMVNIFLFVFVFSKLAFWEHHDYIATDNHERMAYYLHYVSLILTLYFGYKLYQNNKKSPIDFLNSKTIIYIASFLIVYLASSELMLHALVFSNNPVTLQEAQANLDYKNSSTDISYIRDYMAQERIDFARSIIIKTGFPILWGILAFGFLITGIRKKWKEVRILALILLGITILKLFLFDIRNASETGKIIAFILLGVLILIISFVYQKIKVLVIDEKNEAPSTISTDENHESE